jgi:hypothetical protein
MVLARMKTRLLKANVDSIPRWRDVPLDEFTKLPKISGFFFDIVVLHVENVPRAPTDLMKAQKPARKWKGAENMKYILMMSVPKGTGKYEIDTWPKKDLQAHLAFMNAFNRDLRESGEFVAVEGLTGPGQAKVVRAGKDGAPITDGVFPESKEFLAGYWMVDVESPERAYEIAARASAAPGPGGAPLNMPIEVRQMMSGMPDGSL